MRASSYLLGAVVALAAIPAYAVDSGASGVPLSPAPAAGQRLLVIPFNVLNVPESQQWIGQGVQETIVADVGRSGTLVPVPFEGQVVVEDNATAIRLAKAANASYVVRGTAQVVGTNVRITGQLLDVHSGDTLQTAMATGTMMDILNLEDSISAQLGGAAATPPPAVSTAAAPVVAPPLVAQAPQIIVVPGGPTYYMPLPVYTPYLAYDSEPYYGYGYPYIYTYSVVQNRHDHDGDHDGHGGDGHGDGHHDGDHHGFDPDLGPNGDGSGVFHILTRNAGGGGATALPLPTSAAVLPLPTSNVLPLPTTHELPLPTAALPISVRAPSSGGGGSVSRSAALNNGGTGNTGSGKSH